MAYQRKDHYFYKAKEENYAARSAFKLEEIDQRFKLIRPNSKVLDLGAAPGSWSQYCAKKIGPKGRILGIDLQPVRVTLPNAIFFEQDILAIDWKLIMEQAEISPPFDLVLSDMAPRTTGIRITDQTRSMELCRLAFQTATQYLQPGGNFVCKLFHGEEFEAFRKEITPSFEKIQILRPKSTRKESKEVFFIGLKFKKPKEEPKKEQA